MPQQAIAYHTFVRLLAVLVVFVLVPFFIWEGEIAGVASRWLSAGVPVPGIFGAVVALLALDVLLPVPSSLVSASAGSLLGFQLGFLANWLGMTAGCCIGYVIGRVAEPWARGRLIREKDWRTLETPLREYGALTLLVSRPVPVLAEVAVLAAGVLKLPWPRLLAVAAAGNAVVAGIYAGIGALGFSREGFLAAFGGVIVVSGLAKYFFARWLKLPREAVSPQADAE